ncbi:hypothetical protein C6499_03660 [Candidatus Poribacteria bacterium]|nr:MAG: hypothetical protein C6499_03660 [Candidatus Poribacteria bacterium]
MVAFFYRDAVPTELKRFLKTSRFLCKIRFGWNADRNPPLSPLIKGAGVYAAKPNLPDLGLRRLLFLKLTLMVRLQTAPTLVGAILYLRDKLRLYREFFSVFRLGVAKLSLPPLSID